MKLWVASITGSWGTGFHLARTPEALFAYIATFCLTFWEDEGIPIEPVDGDDEANVDIYFDHVGEKETLNMSEVELKGEEDV